MSITLLSNVQIQFEEYFASYSDGDVLEKGTELTESAWYPCLKSFNQNDVNPVIQSEALTYTGYIASGLGNSVVLSEVETNDNRISTRRVMNATISSIRVSTTCNDLWTGNTGVFDAPYKNGNLIVSGKNITNNKTQAGKQFTFTGEICIKPLFQWNNQPYLINK